MGCALEALSRVPDGQAEYSLAPTTSTDAPAVSLASALTRRHASISDRSRSPRQWRRGSRDHLETTGKLLILLESFSTIFSKCALKSLNNQAGFDSAIRRFDPSRPSQLILFVELPLALLHLEMRIPLPEAGMHAMELSSHLGFLPASALPQIGEFLPEQFYDGSDLG